MHVTALVVVLAASQAPPPPAAPDAPAPAPAAKKSVVVLDLEARGVSADEADLVSGLVVDALSKYDGLDVLQKADIKQMAAFEADKQLLGCGEESSCLAEIAGALGAAYVVFGRVGVLDDLILVQLNLFDASAGKPVARQDIRVKKLGDVALAMPHAVGALVQPLTGVAPPPPPVFDEPSPLPGVARWGGLGAGGLGLVVGGVGAGLAGAAAWRAGERSAPADERNGAKALGVAMVVTSAIGVGVAVVGGTVFGLSFLGGA